jgi:hypothetical protein
VADSPAKGLRWSSSMCEGGILYVHPATWVRTSECVCAWAARVCGWWWGGRTSPLERACWDIHSHTQVRAHEHQQRPLAQRQSCRRRRMHYASKTDSFSSIDYTWYNHLIHIYITLAALCVLVEPVVGVEQVAGNQCSLDGLE